jgi:hypothetical protein
VCRFGSGPLSGLGPPSTLTISDPTRALVVEATCGARTEPCVDSGPRTVWIKRSVTTSQHHRDLRQRPVRITSTGMERHSPKAASRRQSHQPPATTPTVALIPAWRIQVRVDLLTKTMLTALTHQGGQTAQQVSRALRPPNHGRLLGIAGEHSSDLKVQRGLSAQRRPSSHDIVIASHGHAPAGTHTCRQRDSMDHPLRRDSAAATVNSPYRQAMPIMNQYVGVLPGRLRRFQLRHWCRRRQVR